MHHNADDKGDPVFGRLEQLHDCHVGLLLSLGLLSDLLHLLLHQPGVAGPQQEQDIPGCLGVPQGDGEVARRGRAEDEEDQLETGGDERDGQKPRPACLVTQHGLENISSK